MRRKRPSRRGAAVLETALVLMPFLIVTMGMLDLGIGVWRYHVVSNAARHVARRAIVRGEMANVLGTWGPSTMDLPATANGQDVIDGTVKGQSIGVQPLLVGCDLDKTRIRVEWLDATGEFEAGVRATVTSPYQPIMLFIFPNQEITLTATSTMHIAH